MAYPPELRDACLDARAAGYSLEAVSAEFGPSTGTISRWARAEKNFPPEKWTDQRRRMVANRCGTGVSIAWLARRYAVSRTSIYAWRKKFCKS